MLMNLETLLAGLRDEEDGCFIDVPEDWAQGRTLFGGLQAAIAVRAARRRVGPAIPLRSLQATFVGPVSPGQVQARARVLRSGRSATQVMVELGPPGRSDCVVVAVFAHSRESPIRIQTTAPELQVPPAQARELPYLEGITPAFTRHYHFRWASGGFPYSGSPEARVQVYLQERDPGPVDECQVICLADAIPTPALSLLSAKGTLSSVTWTLELLDHRFDHDPAAFWRIDSEVTDAADGYGFQNGTLWNPAGRAAALSRQMVVVFT